MPPKRKTLKAAPKRKAQKKNGIFFEKSFYYDKNAPNFDEIKELIVKNDGTLVTNVATAMFHLIPSGWAHKYRDAKEDLIDVSFVTESAALGELLDSENYIVSDLLPIPTAWQNRGKRANSRSPERSTSEGANNRPGKASQSPKGIVSSDVNRETSAAAPPRSPSPNRPQTTRAAVSPFSRRTLPWPRTGVDRFEDPIPLRGRELFSRDDDMVIVGYILRNRGPYSANGDRFWQIAADENLVNGRTWQALQGRYKKTLRHSWNQLLEEYQRWSQR